nr:lipid II flippase MurJ [Acidimicrobiia bacterium]
AMTVPIIRALFERGNFTAESTVATAEALFFYALAIPIWGGLQILNRAFYARKEMWTPVLVGTAATLVAVPLYAIFQNLFGLRGVAFASTLALAIYTGILAAIWYGEKADATRLRQVLAAAGRAIPLAVFGGFAASGVVYGIDQLIDFAALGTATTTVVSVATVVLGTTVFVGVAVIVGGLLHSLVNGRTLAAGPEDADVADEDVDQVADSEPVPDE